MEGDGGSSNTTQVEPTRCSDDRDTGYRGHRERVWDVLADGWTYSGWVVGNSRIRAVSANRPAPGTRHLHSIGTWPAVINDETVVESAKIE
jgi:hypothetical protein